MSFAHHLHDPCPHCPCGCVYFEDGFSGSTLNAHWSVDSGSAAIASGQLALSADSILVCDVLSTDGTPYGVVLAAVCFPAGSPPDAAVRLCCNYDAGSYAFAEYRADGTVHVGTSSGGNDSYSGTSFQADVPVLGTTLPGQAPLSAPLPFQLCYTPEGIIATAQYRADGFDANLVGAGMTAAIGSSKCAVATNAAASSGALVEDFRLSQVKDKNSVCPACAPACGQWQYMSIDAELMYQGLCNMAPSEWTLNVGGGLTNGVTGQDSQNVASLTLSAFGDNYTAPPDVSIPGGDPDATATVSISAGPCLTSASVTNGGSGYDVPPFAFTGIPGWAATATTDGNAVTGITITQVGSGGNPTLAGSTVPITFFSVPGHGTGATGEATYSNGNVVNGIGLNSPGCNYDSTPDVTLSGGGGDGAAATAVLQDASCATPCTGCSGIVGEFTLDYCPWDPTAANHDPAPWGGGQCYPPHPTTLRLDGGPGSPGGWCKWCYYGDSVLCNNDTRFQAGMGIYPGIAPDGSPGYYFQADLYIASLPIPNPYGDDHYVEVQWQAHYQSSVFSLADYPNCTDPLAGGPIDLALFSSLAGGWFGGYLCGTDPTGDPPPSVTLSF
jgi:hypothetical protein